MYAVVAHVPASSIYRTDFNSIWNFFLFFISLSFGIMIKFNLMQTEIFLITFVPYPILYILSVNICMKSVESDNQVDRIDLGFFQNSIHNHATEYCSDLNLNRIGQKKFLIDVLLNYLRGTPKCPKSC